jgi:hypothetical protein
VPLASWGDKAKPPVVCLTWPAALLFLNFGLFVLAVTSQKIGLQLGACASDTARPTSSLRRMISRCLAAVIAMQLIG